MRFKNFLTGILSVIFLMGGAILLAQEIFPPTECEIKIEGSKMAPVKFSHAKHITEYKVNCKTCHHKAKDFTKGVQKCSECHGLEKGKEGAPRVMLAYHKNCINCHKKINAEQEKAAPTKCNQCHKKS